MKPKMSPESIRQHVIDAWRTALPNAALDGRFFDQGGGSLSAVLLVARLERTLGVEVPFAVLVSADGVEGLVSWVLQRLEVSAR